MNKKIILALILLVVVSFFVWLIFVQDVFNFKTASDLQTITDFNSIQAKVVEYYKTNLKLPASLSDVPGASTKYEYQVQSTTNFRLCANFNSDVTDEILAKAPLRVDYTKGHSCIVFNVDSSAESGQTTATVQTVARLTALENKLTVDPTDGVLAGFINIKFDTSQSLFFKNDADGNYLVNFYATVSTSKTCTTKVSPDKGCCYSLNELSLGNSAGTTMAKYNKPGSTDYITPFTKDATDTFGDLPVNLCFQGNKEYTGGISFTIPQSLINVKNTNKLVFKHINNGDTSGVMNITID